MYDPDSDNELNGDFIMAEHDDNSNSYNKEHIPIAKGQPIKKYYEVRFDLAGDAFFFAMRMRLFPTTTNLIFLNPPQVPQQAAAQAIGDFMQNLLRNLGWRSADPQDTENSDSDTIDTSGVLVIELSPVNMDADAAY